MRKLVLIMGVSLDGYVSGPKGELDWSFGTPDDGVDERHKWVLDYLTEETGAIVVGGVAFREMAGYWPFSAEPIAEPMNALPKTLFSSSADPSTWNNTTVARGGLVEEINALKMQSGKNIVAFGGARFAQSLSRNGLVDAYRLTIHPIVLGEGKPLFDGVPQPIPLHLDETKTFPGGAVAHVYSRR